MLSTIVALYVLFGLYPTFQEGYEYQRWFSTIFIGFHRVAWCIALSWVVFACVHGYGGPVDMFLSLPIFQVLGRFTYSMFLIHSTLQSMRSGVLRSPGHFSNLDMVWRISFYYLFRKETRIMLFFFLTVVSPVGRFVFQLDNIIRMCTVFWVSCWYFG